MNTQVKIEQMTCTNSGNGSRMRMQTPISVTPHRHSHWVQFQLFLLPFSLPSIPSACSTTRRWRSGTRWHCTPDHSKGSDRNSGYKVVMVPTSLLREGGREAAAGPPTPGSARVRGLQLMFVDDFSEWGAHPFLPSSQLFRPHSTLFQSTLLSQPE